MNDYPEAVEQVRMSHSPRRSPHITGAVTSPLRSVYPSMQHMDPLRSHGDMGMRTIDNFDDDTSDDDLTDLHPPPMDLATDVDLIGERRRSSATKRHRAPPSIEPKASQCESKGSTLRPDHAGYHHLGPGSVATYADYSPAQGSLASSFNGSVAEVTELLPLHSSPLMGQRKSQLPSGHRTSSHMSAAPAANPESGSCKADKSLSAYAIAHNITLAALMRDEEALDRSIESVALATLQPVHDRRSILPTPVRDNDPRSPRNRDFFPSSPANADADTNTNTTNADNQRTKHIHLISPAINISTTKPLHKTSPLLPRTPYPFPLTPNNLLSSAPPTSTLLHLTLRRNNSSLKPLTSTLTLPHPNDFSLANPRATKTPQHRHFHAPDFDDRDFFLLLKKRYRELSGPWRVVSARSLRRIVVIVPSGGSGRGSGSERERGKGREEGDEGVVSEEEVLRYFRRPKGLRGRYAFVEWARRVADGSPGTRTSSSVGEVGEEEARRVGLATGEAKEDIEEQGRRGGLEFVVGWSVLRISLLLAAVVVLSVLAALLWVFLGSSSNVPGQGRNGYRDAGDRVTGGAVVGICVLLLGLSSMAGWLGVSWLVM